MMRSLRNLQRQLLAVPEEAEGGHHTTVHPMKGWDVSLLCRLPPYGHTLFDTPLETSPLV